MFCKAIVAQKTNGVNNLPPMSMPPRSLPPAVETVAEEDVARGWRVENVTTNDAYSFAMPSDASHVGNWHIHGARSSFGNNLIDFGAVGAPRPTGWSFPLGTNGAAFSSFWYFVDGRIRPTPKDAEHEICVVGVPMSAVPGQSRLWIAEEPDDSRVLTWENFFLNGGNPFSMDVLPSNLDGVFSWQPLGCACSISGSGSTFSFNCSQSCTCCGSSAEGTYAYEGYFLFTSTCPCGCYYDGTGPAWTETPVTPPYTNSVSASVSATFTEPAVIFENAYENRPGDWVPRRSTRTRLNIVADGGMNGAELTVSTTNLVKLSHLSGPVLPLASVSVPAETSVGYSIVYEGCVASSWMGGQYNGFIE